MFNYIANISKSTAVTHCLSCNFFSQEKLNLILSKTDIIEIYDLTKEGLMRNIYINIYGKIILMISIPSHEKNKKDNLFVLSEDLDFALFSYNNNSNNIETILCGSINEEIGRKQDGVLYSLDLMKNFLLLSAFKNVFKLICVNNNMRIKEKYQDFSIKYQYEDILFLAPFSLNYFFKDNIEKHYKNILTFATIKTDIIDNTTNNATDTSSNELPQEISLETFQIILEPDYYKYYPYIWKDEVFKLINPESKQKQKDDKSYSIDDMNLFQKIDLSENPTVSLMITHPDGLIILFFSDYIQYYKYDHKKKKLIAKKDKKISFEERKFTTYSSIGENDYRYFVIDEYGNLFLLALISPFSEDKDESKLLFQFLGEINYSTCLAYLDNNYLFVGSNKANSQLIKIEKSENNFVKVIENFDTLAPISNITLVNKNIENENHVELVTISGIDKKCNVNMIKKGIPAIFEDELEIKNIKNVFKVSLNKNNNSISTFFISTISNSFILDYDQNSNKLCLNTQINIDRKDIIIFAEIIHDSTILLLVSKRSIILYHIKENGEIKLTQSQIFDTSNVIKPLLVKYNKKLNSVFIYYNNKKFMQFIISTKGEIADAKEIFNNINLSSFAVCKYFIIYSEWDKNHLGIYTINTRKNSIMNIAESSKDFAQISSIEIIKVNGLRFILLSLSNGKLLYFKLKEQFRNYNYYDFTESDFVFKRKYNVTNENYTIRKIKIKDNTERKYLFFDMTTPCFAFINKEAIVLLNLSIKSCKNILQLDKDKYLFVYNNKISFGSLSNVQSQNITSKLYGKQLYNIEAISFYNYNINITNIKGKENNIQEKNKQKISNYLLTIEEEKLDKNTTKTSLVLSDIYLKEISRYNFEKENEICISFSEIQKNNDIDTKIIVAGTGISEYPNEEPNTGFIYLIEIDYKNNYSMKKIKEIQTKGGIYKIKALKNCIYASIGNTLFIYKIIKNYESKKLTESYEIKLIKKYSQFTLINDIYLYDYNPNFDENQQIKTNADNNITKSEKKNKIEIEEDEFANKINENDISDNEEENKSKSEENKSKNEEDIHYIIISDLYRSIVLYSYDVNNDKLNEICRDYNLTWVYSISQYKNNLLYISDIDGNIVSLEKNLHPKSDQENFRFERRAYFNLSERINSMVMTSIKNPKLFLLSPDNNSFSIIESENLEENIPEDVNVTYYGTMEGSVGIIISLKKEVYDFLKALECAIIKRVNNFGNFDYDKWRSFKDGFNNKKAVGFVEGNIVEDFLNYDESLKMSIINEMKFPWDKNLSDIVNIIETLAKCH